LCFCSLLVKEQWSMSQINEDKRLPLLAGAMFWQVLSPTHLMGGKLMAVTLKTSLKNSKTVVIE